jgi:hypothetical protein
MPGFVAAKGLAPVTSSCEVDPEPITTGSRSNDKTKDRAVVANRKRNKIKIKKKIKKKES